MSKKTPSRHTRAPRILHVHQRPGEDFEETMSRAAALAATTGRFVLPHPIWSGAWRAPHQTKARPPAA